MQRKNYRFRKNTPIELKEAVEVLESRGLKVLWIQTYSPIYGRYREQYLRLWNNQIVNDDDLPDSCEVVYVYKNYKNIEMASYDDPVNCCREFTPLIFVKRKRTRKDSLYGIGHESVKTYKRRE